MSGHYTLDLGLIIPWTSGFALKPLLHVEGRKGVEG